MAGAGGAAGDAGGLGVTKVRRGAGLAAINTVGTEQNCGNRESGAGQAKVSDETGRGRDDSDGKHSLSQHGMGTRKGDFICGLSGQTFHPGCFGRDVLCWNESCDHLLRRRSVCKAQDCGGV